MIKLLFGGVWACAVTLLAAYGATQWSAKAALAGAEQGAVAVETRKTRQISVPMIADGTVQGYIVVQLFYTVDLALAKTMSAQPDIYIIDEAFRALYGDPRLDFRRLERYDLNRLTKLIVEKSKARFGTDVVKDVLVNEFNYVSKDELKK